MTKIKIINVSMILAFLVSIESRAAPEFDLSEISTGEGISQTIMTAFLKNSNSADLITINVSQEFDRTLSIFGMTDNLYSQNPSVNIPLSENIIAADVGRYKNRDALIFFTDREALLFDQEQNTETVLIEYSSIYNLPLPFSVPQLNLFYDLNNDGLDDFIIPGFSAISIYFQGNDGGFSQPLLLEIPARMNVSSGELNGYQMPSATYSAIESYLADLNADGIKDLVFWIEEELVYFSGNKQGFDTIAHRYNANLPFVFGDSVELNRAMEADPINSESTLLYQLDDLNNDQITDVMVLSTSTESLLNITTTYEIYNGTDASTGEVEFQEKPNSLLVSDGIQFGVQQQDFNFDGQVDFMISSVKVGLGKIIKALLTGSVKVQLNFYLMNDSLYPDEPNFVRDIKVKFDLGSGQLFYPVILIEDFDNDGLADLMVQRDGEIIDFYAGIADPAIFSKRSTDIRVNLPTGEPEENNRKVQVIDLNNDNRVDLLIHHTSKTENNKLTVLLSSH